VKPLWVESHTMAQLTEEQHLNAEAYQLAITRLRKGATSNPTIAIQLLTNQVTVQSHKKVITAGLPQQIIMNIYYKPLKDKILKDKNWPLTDFDKVE